MVKDRVEINSQLIGNNQLLKENLDLQKRIFEYENIEMKRALAAQMRKPSSDIEKLPVEWGREVGPNGVMYQ